MSGTQKFPAVKVRPHVERFLAELAPACARIVVAGSLRRFRYEVGDVELVAISLPHTPQFGQPAYPDQLTARLAELEHEQRITRYAYPDRPTLQGKWGTRYKELRIMVGGQFAPWKVDLFITTAEQFGAIWTIRTGPAEFSQAFVTALHQVGLRQDDGWLTRDGARISTPEEEDYFAALGIDVIRPQDRTAARLWMEFRRAQVERPEVKPRQANSDTSPGGGETSLQMRMF